MIEGKVGCEMHRTPHRLDGWQAGCHADKSGYSHSRLLEPVPSLQLSQVF